MRSESLFSWRGSGSCLIQAALLLVFAPCALAQHPGIADKPASAQCRRALLESSIHSGQGFQAEFAQGFVFGLEPLPSGWALRVVAANKPRGPHDLAELATLPYASVSPLLLSTDWAFRAQDAAGWTPRRFRYASTESANATLAAGYDAVVRGDDAASRQAAALSEAQPEGLFEIEDVRLAPGMANQTPMAAAVSAHFTQTPHTVDTAAPPSPLGHLEQIRFRVSLDLPTGLLAAKGVKITVFPCPRPTVGVVSASEPISKRISR